MNNSNSIYNIRNMDSNILNELYNNHIYTMEDLIKKNNKLYNSLKGS